ncbi:hypothetical protein [Phenylobacterium sp.]|uniref:hypothetical protein n=1 Tax=Phenylobacterium sp. TaxID=1871053 RepID=UPI002F91F25B
MLAQLASMTFTLARELSNRALEAESDDDAVKLAAAFHQVSRGLRQTLALEMKVIRFRAELERDIWPRAAGAQSATPHPAASAESSEKRHRVASAVEPLIWNEREKPDFDEDEAHARRGRLQTFLDGAERRPTSCASPWPTWSKTPAPPWASTRLRSTATSAPTANP